jgi:hypothetical protein
MSAVMTLYACVLPRIFPFLSFSAFCPLSFSFVFSAPPIFLSFPLPIVFPKKTQKRAA